VFEWKAPPKGDLPTFTFLDLTDPENPTGLMKNGSAMVEYNTYSTGKGGVCDTVRLPSFVTVYCRERGEKFGALSRVDLLFVLSLTKTPYLPSERYGILQTEEAALIGAPIAAQVGGRMLTWHAQLQAYWASQWLWC